jgi:hypothetical protein
MGYYESGTVDVIAPFVVSARPYDGTVGNSVNLPAVIKVNESLDPATVNTTNVSISPSVANVVSLSANTITLLPSAPLAVNTTYTVTVSGVRDVTGNALPTKIYSFTTAATTNILPVANAGIDKVINLAVSSVMLSGSGTDDDGVISGYLWAKLSGPASSNISAPTLAMTPVSALTAGTYVFRLVVMDNLGGIAADDVQVLFRLVVMDNLGGIAADDVQVLVNPIPPLTGFAYWNYVDKGNNTTLSNNNLTQVAAVDTQSYARGTQSRNTGKYYWEYHIESSNVTDASFGIGNASTNLNANDDGSANVYIIRGDGRTFGGGVGFTNNTLAGGFSQGDYIGVLLDLDNHSIVFRRNGGVTAVPMTVASGSWFPYAGSYLGATQITANFGSSAFAHPVPSGFTAGLPDSSNQTQTCDLDVNASGGFTITDARTTLAWMLGFRGAALENISDSSVRSGSAIDIFLQAQKDSLALDLDGNNEVHASTDGVMLMRVALGLTGDPVTANAVNLNGSRKTWTAVRGYLANTCKLPL